MAGALAMAIFFFFLILHRHLRPSLNLPPSPRFALPFLGHLYLLPGTLRHSKLTALTSKLGPIFSLRLGDSPSVFITSASLAHEALVSRGSIFASRPQTPSRALFTSNFRNINASRYGSYWRAMRRNLVHEMLASTKLLSFQPARARILQLMIQRLLHQALHNHGVVAVYQNCRFSMLQLLLFMCLGTHIPDDSVLQIQSIIEEILPLQLAQLDDFLPCLRFLQRNKLKRRQAVRQKQIELFTSLIDTHKKLRKVGEVTPGSYLETLLRMDGEGEFKLSDSDLVTLCTEFLVAGTDTTVNCMEWTMAHLVKDQKIQHRLYEEIERVVGSRSVEEDDLANMPYLQAVVKETLRLHPPGHFTLPHAVTEPCKIAGYDIPANTIVNFHLTSISRDPDVWEEPLEYKPDRFFTRDVDITGSREVTMIPFGAGRRVCPGAGLALMHVELFIARLVQQFEWRTSKPGEIVDMSEKTRFTVVMKHPLMAAITDRRAK